MLFHRLVQTAVRRGIGVPTYRTFCSQLSQFDSAQQLQKAKASKPKDVLSPRQENDRPSTTYDFTTHLEIVDPTKDPVIPAYRVMDTNGTLLRGSERDLLLDEKSIVKMYHTMGEVAALDHILMQAQRHGRVSFHMQNAGEEALQVGSAAALEPQDHIFSQYRELGVFLWRGFDMQQVAHQCLSNAEDLGKGKQMPMHFGCGKLNMYTISSPLTTQLPQAAGCAYALKRRNTDACVMCYFGDGAASEGDFHAAMNFASTLDCPVIFFCRNNGWAISTPVSEQYRGDGILSRAKGYGMKGLRVDGNDMFAVHEATREARKYAVNQSRPVLIEAMSYRRGHHSTSDDSTTYRLSEELDWWAHNDCPAKRVRLHLEKRDVWDSEMEAEMRTMHKKKVLKCLGTAEKTLKPNISELFTDVYAEMPERLKRQQNDLEEHLKKYGTEYNLSKYQS
ncbi:hypothetical protein AAMO2058_000670800 [Amorphochlora amoebiformis]